MAELGAGDYPVHPAKPGLLPVASTDAPIYVCFLTEGKPDKWPIVVQGAGYQEFERYDVSLTAFFARLFGGREDTPPWEDGWYKPGDTVFEPMRYVAEEPPDPPASRTILELYEENGRRADFWITMDIMGPTDAYHVREVLPGRGGKGSGVPTFVVDLYEDGEPARRTCGS